MQGEGFYSVLSTYKAKIKDARNNWRNEESKKNIREIFGRSLRWPYIV